MAGRLCALSVLVCLGTGLGAQAPGSPPGKPDGEASTTSLASRSSQSQDRGRGGGQQPLARSERLVTLDLHDVPLQDALDTIAEQSGVAVLYGDNVVPLERKVSVRVTDVPAVDALRAVLREVDVEARETAAGKVVLVKRAKRRPAAEPNEQQGTIAGRVIDAKTGLGIAAATVMADGTRHRATTGDSGQFRIGGVEAGTYTVSARRIGYGRASQQVTVVAEQETVVEFRLEPAPTLLDQVVVTTPGGMTSEVRALPTPVTIITADEIALQRPNNLQTLFRQAIPGAVSFNIAAAPYTTNLSVRGASTLAVGTQMKIFVDGIEAALPARVPIDPNSIERIEVIRGPQAAAIYGSDAIGGVIQVFTKRGNANLVRPQVNVEAAGGVLQSPYEGFERVPRQQYTVSVRGGGTEAGYNFGAGYAHTGDYLPNGQPSAQSSPSIYGGVRLARGIVTADVSGRYLTNEAPQVFNPELTRTGFTEFKSPYYQSINVQNQTVGARTLVTPTNWWQHTVTVGLDRFFSELEQTQPRRTTPEDTLLQVFFDERTKTFVGYNTSVQGPLGSAASGSLTVGFDHYNFSINQFSTAGAVTTTGTIRTTPTRPVSATRTTTNNTGYFAQAQLGVREALFLTAGVRAERNTEFGGDIGTPMSPRVGLTYTWPIGAATLKMRSSWGRAIRPPAPGRRLAGLSGSTVILANAILLPERQRGWDAGMDAAFGSRASVSVTYYDQTADDLIQLVEVESAPNRTVQYQNVGRVENSGMEFEGTLSAGILQLRSQYAYTRSRIRELGPNYAGNLMAGDRPLTTPTHTAGASATITAPTRTTMTAGITYVGSYRSQDYIALVSCFSGTGSCRPASRDYIVDFPGFTKVNATVSQPITPVMSSFVSVDNLTNNTAYELGNAFPVHGRVTMVGLRIAY